MAEGYASVDRYKAMKTVSRWHLVLIYALYYAVLLRIECNAPSVTLERD